MSALTPSTETGGPLVTLTTGVTEALNVVLEAAERHKHELLGQATKYENLGMPSIAKETMDEHYTPLKEAMDTVQLLISGASVRERAR